MSFADGVDMAVMLKHDIERMLDRTIPIQVFTDSLSLFDVITRSTTTVEKRLMIDIAAAVNQGLKPQLLTVVTINLFSPNCQFGLLMF
jgi:hypothetical protein